MLLFLGTYLEKAPSLDTPKFRLALVKHTTIRGVLLPRSECAQDLTSISLTGHQIGEIRIPSLEKNKNKKREEEEIENNKANVVSLTGRYLLCA